eukprot:15077617-Alexandrium_andersonii.AAC.1
MEPAINKTVRTNCREAAALGGRNLGARVWRTHQVRFRHRGSALIGTPVLQIGLPVGRAAREGPQRR